MLRPKFLKDNGTIAIVSPSSSISAFPRRMGRGVRELEKLNYSVMFMPNALHSRGRNGPSPEEKAEDIMSAVCNESVDLVMASTGGYTSNTVLDLLDFEVIARSLKIFVGFSDASSLLLAVSKKSNLICFHGPTLLPSFGRPNGVEHETLESFLDLVKGVTSSQNLLHTFSRYSEDNLLWDRDDDHSNFFADHGPIAIRGGVAEGRTIVSNLDSLISLLPTEYCPQFTGAILFIEEAGSTTSKTIRNITTLEQAGVLDKIAGLVVGRTYKYDDDGHPFSVDAYWEQLSQKYNIPMVIRVPFGHTEPKLTIPVGALAILDADKPSLKLLENCVSVSH